MRPFDKYRRIKLAKARKIKKNRNMTEEQVSKQLELNIKIHSLDEYKLAQLKNMMEALTNSEKTFAKVVIHCAGFQFVLNREQSIEILREANRCLQIERQQLIKALESV